MSDRPIDIDLTTNTEKTVDKIPSPEELQAFRARIAQVLSREITVDRGEVTLPHDLEGYWCPDDPVSKAQAELRGYTIDTEYAKRNGLSDKGDGKFLMGDVFFMVRPKWMGTEENKIRQQRYYETHLRDRRKQKEEKDFLANNSLPPIVSSQSDEVSGSQIEEALTKGK